MDKVGLAKKTAAVEQIKEQARMEQREKDAKIADSFKEDGFNCDSNGYNRTATGRAKEIRESK